jgi:hypothetical protein
MWSELKSDSSVCYDAKYIITDPSLALEKIKSNPEQFSLMLVDYPTPRGFEGKIGKQTGNTSGNINKIIQPSNSVVSEVGKNLTNAIGSSLEFFGEYVRLKQSLRSTHIP